MRDLDHGILSQFDCNTKMKIQFSLMFKRSCLLDISSSELQFMTITLFKSSTTLAVLLAQLLLLLLSTSLGLWVTLASDHSIRRKVHR